eukprot:jgi/Mesvir1/5982/Mv00736-RA.1
MGVASVIKTLYLVLYNSAQAVGWAGGFTLTVNALYYTGRWESVFWSASPFIAVCQLASLLEVIHAATGLVRTSAANALLQWAGRWHVILVLKYIAPAIQIQPAVTSLFLAWSLSEMIRYPQYALSLLKACPRWLEWLRYSAFIVLYPIGVSSEIPHLDLPGIVVETVFLHAGSTVQEARARDGG